jgi:hypothetical protein
MSAIRGSLGLGEGSQALGVVASLGGCLVVIGRLNPLTAPRSTLSRGY